MTCHQNCVGCGRQARLLNLKKDIRTRHNKSRTHLLTLGRIEQIACAGRVGGKRTRHWSQIGVLQVGKRFGTAKVDQRLHGRIEAQHLCTITTCDYLYKSSQRTEQRKYTKKNTQKHNTMNEKKRAGCHNNGDRILQNLFHTYFEYLHRQNYSCL